MENTIYREEAFRDSIAEQKLAREYIVWISKLNEKEEEEFLSKREWETTHLELR